MFEKYLQEIGLSDKEAQLYLALLQIDNSSVLDLSKKTKLKRPTVYVVLETLLKKGLVSETTAGKKTHYQAEPPERLETFVERQKVVLDERSKRLKDIIPQIKSVQKESGERPVVRFFEGREGIVSANEDVYDGKPDGSPVYLFYSRDAIRDVFSDEELQLFKKQRIKQNIRSKALYNNSKGALIDNSGDRILIDEKKYPFFCDVSMYKNKVRISIIGKKLSGILIESKEFADTLKSLFNLAFDNLNKKSDPQE